MYRVSPRMYDLNMMAGSSFITWLQKLGRVCEDILLGYVDEKIITFDHLKFNDPPDPSSVASVRGSSPSGLLPSISPQKRSQSAHTKQLFSPSSEIISSERSVSRGVGSNDSLQLSTRYLSPPKTTNSLITNSKNSPLNNGFEEDEFDPYIPYMIHTFHHESTKSSKKSQRQQHNQNQNQLDLERSKSPTNFNDSSNESIISNITENTLRFSPINSNNNNNNRSLFNQNEDSKNQPMVSSLLGINPWNEINTNKSSHQKYRKREKGI